jgi:hypothetical protein
MHFCHPGALSRPGNYQTLLSQIPVRVLYRSSGTLPPLRHRTHGWQSVARFQLAFQDILTDSGCNFLVEVLFFHINSITIKSKKLSAVRTAEQN